MQSHFSHPPKAGREYIAAEQISMSLVLTDATMHTKALVEARPSMGTHVDNRTLQDRENGLKIRLSF